MSTYLLNLADLALTLYALRIGCCELNPLMQSVPAMVVYKTIIVGGLCWVLHHFRKVTKKAERGLTLCAVFYGGLCIYHLFGILMIGGTQPWHLL